MLYFLVTTCIYDNSLVRAQQYINGITQLKHVISKYPIYNYKIILIENNGKRNTYLDFLGCEIFYTYNNSLSFPNKGYKELKDIHDCIRHYSINDSDFIVKMTGRYLLHNDSDFISKLSTINYDCLIKYGPYYAPVNYKMKDCITGLIGMRCFYIKKIVYPVEGECVEWKWGEATFLIDDAEIVKVNSLGITIFPGNGEQLFFL